MSELGDFLRARATDKELTALSPMLLRYFPTLKAEAEAMRWIVMQCERVLGLPDEDEANWLATITLRALVRPYVEHPDFRPEWLNSEPTP